MSEYYLFIIKDKTLKKPNDLYNVLFQLYKMKKNLNYGISLYKQLCSPFNISILSKYLTKYNSNNKNIFYIDNSIIILKPSRIIIKSNDILNIIKIFNFNNKNIFVCDFKNDYYFWLNDNKVKEYI